MSLNKQKILNELGSVVNQLQSADCGCMSRLFNGGTNQNNCGDGHAYHASHRGWGQNPCAGEPHMASCVAHCNPPKLIADTYNYYDQHVVKPAMEEVYNELKSITPENTIINHPLASQMGVSQAAVKQNQGQAIGQGRQFMGGVDHQGHTMAGMNEPGQVMNGLQAGMGEQMQEIGGVMPGQHQAVPGMSGNHPCHVIGGMTSGEGQLMTGILGNHQGQPVNGMMSGPGQVMGEMMPRKIQRMGERFGQNLVAAQGNIMPGQGQALGGMTGQMQGHSIAPVMVGQGQGMVGMSGQNTSQKVSSIPGVQGQYMGSMVGTQDQSMVGQNRGIGGMSVMNSQQMYSTPIPHPMGKQQGVGEHAAALKKFNEVFPGMMSGDLSFNPMEMAIKMNPNNKQAFNPMNSPETVNNMQPAQQIPGINQQLINQPQVPANMNQQQIIRPQNMHQVPTKINQQYVPQMLNQQHYTANVNQQHMPQMMNQQQVSANINQQHMPPVINQQHMPPVINQQPNQQEMQQMISQQQMPHVIGQWEIPQQQVNQHQMPNSMNQQDLMQYQNVNQHKMLPLINQQQIPSTMSQQAANSEVLSTTGATYVNTHATENMSAPQKMQQSPTMEPIMPVVPETGYNTLGQPVEMVSGNLFRRHDTGPPHSLIGSGYGFNKVKNTISKTSIMGHHLKGSYKTPSRSQLQNLYNQYKGSQSYTQQNIQDPKYAGTASDGKLDVIRRNIKQHIPLEREGGDTAMNNMQLNQQVKADSEASNLHPNMIEQVIGDEPNKIPKQENLESNKAGVQESAGMPSKRCRNGLQDMVYTTYSLGASWTFHGSTPPRPRIYRPTLL